MAQLSPTLSTQPSATVAPNLRWPDAVRDWPGMAQLLACSWGHPLVRVALLASPVDPRHPNLAASGLDQLIPLGSSIPHLYQRRGELPRIDTGTHLARILFGRAEANFRGLAPLCRALVLPIYQAAGDGALASCRPHLLATAIRQALDHGAHVICIGGCEAAMQSPETPQLQEALQRCAENNVLVVCPAPLLGQAPRRSPVLLRVHGLDYRGRPLTVDDEGRPATHSDLLAPGEALLPDIDGRPELYGSSALAAAVVTGIAALLLSLQLRHRQHCDPLAVRNALLRGALPHGQRQWRLDPGGAVARLSFARSPAASAAGAGQQMSG